MCYYNLFINYIHNEQTNGWGCGVFSKHKLNEIIIDKCHPSAIAICETNINSINIIAISLYGQIIDGFAITTLHRSLSDLTPIFQKKSLRDYLLIGGDFNADTELDKRREKWKVRKTDFNSGTLWKYAQTVGPAYLGAPTHPGKKKEVKDYSKI